MGLPIVGSDTFRIDLIEGLYRFQRHQGQIPDITFGEYVKAFNNARKGINKRRTTKTED